MKLKTFFVSAVSELFLKLIYHGAGVVVHLLMLKCSMTQLIERSLHIYNKDLSSKHLRLHLRCDKNRQTYVRARALAGFYRLACLPSIPTTRVQILLTCFYFKNCLKKAKINEKEMGMAIQKY